MEPRSPGYTLVEILVVVLITAVMMGAMYETLVVQQKGYREQKSRVEARHASRTALDLLTTELREIAASSGDLLVAEPESVTFRSIRKIGIVYDVDAPDSTLNLWRLSQEFEAGDGVFAYINAGDSESTEDDTWSQGAVAGASAVRCAESWNGYPCQTLAVSGIELGRVDVGAPVRGFEPLTYGIYSDDGDWVLGRHRPNENAVVLVGPLAAPELGGLRFQYFDASGTELAPPLRAAERNLVDRIDILVRGMSLGTGSGERPESVDSLTARVHLRGNAWY